MIRFAFILTSIFFSSLVYSQDISSKLFIDQIQPKSTLRIDYLLAGNDIETVVYLWQLKKEPHWGGPHKNLIDPWNSGNYRSSAYDSATNKLLYRQGFSSLFEEFQGTQEANGIRRAFPMTAIMPFPVHTILFEIDHRINETGQFEPLFTLFVNPQDHFILHEKVTPFSYTKIIDHGAADTLLDIAMIAEGYTLNEMSKFREDASRIADYLLSVEPYASLKHKINIYAIESPSVESGVDIPGHGNYANTNINSSFYTFGSERYLTTPDTWSMRDIAANVPYDQIIILNNSKKYGGGGFYNHYCQSTVDHKESEIVAIHEFGHAFG
ncbi:MAG: peptidase, partial [Bacteroidia bacterium]|nr:peptidase [Bacteroidia bacterium]